jgi:hypothetical protein
MPCGLLLLCPCRRNLLAEKGNSTAAAPAAKPAASRDAPKKATGGVGAKVKNAVAAAKNATAAVKNATTAVSKAATAAKDAAAGAPK